MQGLQECIERALVAIGVVIFVAIHPMPFAGGFGVLEFLFGIFGNEHHAFEQLFVHRVFLWGCDIPQVGVLGVGDGIDEGGDAFVGDFVDSFGVEVRGQFGCDHLEIGFIGFISDDDIIFVAAE